MEDAVDWIKKEGKRLWLPILLGIAAWYGLGSSVFFTGLGRLAMIAMVFAGVNILRKSYWPGLDIVVFAKKTIESPMASSVVFTVLMTFLMVMVSLTLAHGAMTDATILAKARPHMHIFRAVVDKHWPGAPNPENLPGKVEQETCATMRQCWNSHTELKTAREYGFSYSQMTVAYNKDGSERFNKFDEARRQYHELVSWKWADRYNDEYQFIFITLESRRLYETYRRYFTHDVDAEAASLVAYNAGGGTVTGRIAVCRHTTGCDATRWFGGLDSVVIPGEQRLLYGRSLHDRRNEYPDNIINRRAAKYVKPWAEA